MSSSELVFEDRTFSGTPTTALGIVEDCLVDKSCTRYFVNLSKGGLAGGTVRRVREVGHNKFCCYVNRTGGPGGYRVGAKWLRLIHDVLHPPTTIQLLDTFLHTKHFGVGELLRMKKAT